MHVWLVDDAILTSRGFLGDVISVPSRDKKSIYTVGVLTSKINPNEQNHHWLMERDTGSWSLWVQECIPQWVTSVRSPVPQRRVRCPRSAGMHSKPTHQALTILNCYPRHITVTVNAMYKKWHCHVQNGIKRDPCMQWYKRHDPWDSHSRLDATLGEVFLQATRRQQRWTTIGDGCTVGVHPGDRGWHSVATASLLVTFVTG